MRGHEALTGSGTGGRRQLQHAAFAANRFGDQERLRVRMVQAGRVELYEFHIRYPTTRAPRHRNAVTGSSVRIRRVQVYLAGAAGGQHRLVGGDGDDLLAVHVLHVQPIAMGRAVADAELVRRDQVDRDVIL